MAHYPLLGPSLFRPAKATAPDLWGSHTVYTRTRGLYGLEEK